MEQIINLLFGSFTGQLTLAVMGTILAMTIYFIYLFMKKPEDI